SSPRRRLPTPDQHIPDATVPNLGSTARLPQYPGRTGTGSKDVVPHHTTLALARDDAVLQRIPQSSHTWSPGADGQCTALPYRYDVRPRQGTLWPRPSAGRLFLRRNGLPISRREWKISVEDRSDCRRAFSPAAMSPQFRARRSRVQLSLLDRASP